MLAILFANNLVDANDDINVDTVLVPYLRGKFISLINSLQTRIVAVDVDVDFDFIKFFSENTP